MHLASLGCPLAIDPLYGDSSLSRPPEISRLTLHASSLTFPAPSDSKPRTAQAALPPDFHRALESLRKMPDLPLPPGAPAAPTARARRRKV